jgi:hypothetical protein
MQQQATETSLQATSTYISTAWSRRRLSYQPWLFTMRRKVVGLRCRLPAWMDPSHPRTRTFGLLAAHLACMHGLNPAVSPAVKKGWVCKPY